MHTYASLMACIPGKPGLAGYPSTLPLIHLKHHPTYHVLKTGKGGERTVVKEDEWRESTFYDG